MNLFVSYTTRDGHWTHERLKQIQMALEELGNVFIDALREPRPDQETVIASLIQADVVVILTSPDYISSPWSAKEFDLAKSLGKRLVLIEDLFQEEEDLRERIRSVAPNNTPILEKVALI